MECLACGDCCRRMSPLSPDTDGLNREPCKHLEFDGDVAICRCYESRPQECRDHCFPAHICPIGMSELGLTTLEDAEARAYHVFVLHGGQPI
jgi:hypothetical protein